jgi:hypothetical protein
MLDSVLLPGRELQPQMIDCDSRDARRKNDRIVGVREKLGVAQSELAFEAPIYSGPFIPPLYRRR